MSSEIPPSWEQRELSNREAILKLIKTGLVYSPTFVLKSLREHPGTTLTVISGLGAGGAALTGHMNEAVLAGGAAFAIYFGSAVATGAQVPLQIVRHEWKNYKRGTKEPLFFSDIKIRNFL